MHNGLQLGDYEVVRRICVRVDVVSQHRQESVVSSVAQPARDPDPSDFRVRLDG